MLDSLTKFLTEGISIKDKGVLISAIIIFPLSYCGLDILYPIFSAFDIFTKCMYSCALTILLLSLSLLFLLTIQVLEGSPIRKNIIFLVSPVVYTIITFNPKWIESNDISTIIRCIFYSFARFYAIFLVYGLIMSIIRKRRERAKETQEYITSQRTKGEPDGKA